MSEDSKSSQEEGLLSVVERVQRVWKAGKGRLKPGVRGSETRDREEGDIGPVLFPRAPSLSPASQIEHKREGPFRGRADMEKPRGCLNWSFCSLQSEKHPSKQRQASSVSAWSGVPSPVVSRGTVGKVGPSGRVPSLKQKASSSEGYTVNITSILSAGYLPA